jgi:hypothetical protein
MDRTRVHDLCPAALLDSPATSLAYPAGQSRCGTADTLRYDPLAAAAARVTACSVRKFGARAAGRCHAYLAFMSGCLVPGTDRHDRASTLSCLGTVALERFADARVAGEGEPVLLEHLNAALRSYRQSLELTPADDHQARGAREHQLGIVYSRAGDTSQALRHYQRSSR